MRAHDARSARRVTCAVIFVTVEEYRYVGCEFAHAIPFEISIRGSDCVSDLIYTGAEFKINDRLIPMVRPRAQEWAM